MLRGGSFSRPVRDGAVLASAACPAVGAFEIDALFPEQDGVSPDYRGHDGLPVRTQFQFDDTGKI
jgi:hypothetical protein